MGVDRDTPVRVSWTRAELEAVREALELTPGFDGRADLRTLLREAAGARRIEPVVLGLDVAERFAGRLAPSDFATAIAKVKLQQAIRPHARSGPAARVAAR